MVPDNATRGSGVNTEHPLFRQSGQPPPLKSIHVLPPGGNGSGGRLLYTAAHHGRSASISVASTQHPHNAIDTKLEPTYPWDYDEDEDVSCLAADVVSLTRGRHYEEHVLQRSINSNFKGGNAMGNHVHAPPPATASSSAPVAGLNDSL